MLSLQLRRQIWGNVYVESEHLQPSNQERLRPRPWLSERDVSQTPQASRSGAPASHITMTRDSRHGTLWKGLACLFALQLPLVGAQLAEVEKATNASLLWGPYRPNLYFGVRPRIPKSLMGGLMWTRVEDYQSVQNSKYHW